MARLSEFANNTTSQNGEDGMVAKLAKDLELETGWCVEFGAWDGKHLSNTWDLWANQGWRAFLLEALPSRFADLEHQTKNPSVVAMCARVGWDGDNRLDHLLAVAEVPADFELLSIDIDGDDYWVWEATASRPKIVIVEYNSSFAPEVEFVQEKEGYTGSSAASFVRLADDKGYTLVDLTITNLIFVRSDLIPTLSVDTLPLDELFDRSWLPIIYSDYAGVHHLIKSGPWPFSDIRIDLGQKRFVGPLRRFVAKGPARSVVTLLRKWSNEVGSKASA
ncbi:MAG TPA: hypothetical protein VHU17_18875 [Acidimicrobiales bacterium]|jgi:hypothetical protein|nr:hypothetical protein [Acidimicrobiales bacterium]